MEEDNDSKVVRLAKQLIEKKSITPNDEGCQFLLASLLEKAGFMLTPLKIGDTENLWATHSVQSNNKSIGDTPSPILCFAGHTDVVPPGNLEQWETNPFTPIIKNGMLYGRGAADMKGSLAAMVTAAIQYVENNPNHKGTLAFLITSDEEGSAQNGTKAALAQLNEANQNLKIDWCVVGEPSSDRELGDTIKVGRRGSLSGILTVKGIQGHVAYPHLASNPLHTALPALSKMVTTELDNGNALFPPTSLQITQIHFGVNADNVIPGEMTVYFNLRFSPESTENEIKKKISGYFSDLNLNFDIQWRLSGLPFLTNKESPVINALMRAVHKVLNRTPQCSTAGGTSDGRFFAPMGTEVVEIGPVNRTIHKINECVQVSDLVQLEQIYFEVMSQLLNE